MTAADPRIYCIFVQSISTKSDRHWCSCRAIWLTRKRNPLSTPSKCCKNGKPIERLSTRVTSWKSANGWTFVAITVSSFHPLWSPHDIVAQIHSMFPICIMQRICSGEFCRWRWRGRDGCDILHCADISLVDSHWLNLVDCLQVNWNELFLRFGYK